MTKEQFAAHLTQQLYQIYPQEDYTIRIDSFIKNNNTMHYGIIIRKNTECFAPTIYIDDFYDDYLKKKLTTDEIAAQVHQIMTGFPIIQNTIKHFPCAGRTVSQKLLIALFPKSATKIY